MSATKEHHHDAIEAGQRGAKQHPIGWLNMPGYKPETWNPIIGCSKVSPGCDNCYALAMAKRIAGMERATGRINYRATLMPGENNIQSEWNGHTFLVNEAFTKPASWKSKRIVFVNSMGDLFHEGHLYEWIDAVFSAMSDYDQHIYILLTKRPEKMLKFWQWKREQHGIDWRPKDNVWIGVTAENQEQADKRIPILLQIPASKHFVSIEPMLGPVDLTHIDHDWQTNALTGKQSDMARPWYDTNKLDWVICGGETGPKARPMNQNWVIEVKNQCKEAKVPFFFKQWGEWEPRNANSFALKNDPKSEKYQLKKVPYADNPFEFSNVSKVGRKNAGNLLDGQQHHECPQIPSAKADGKG